MSRTGKCTNFSGCLLAYRGEETSVADGQPFVCAECGKPLSEVKAAAGKWIIYAVAGVAAVGVLAGLAIAVPKILSKKSAAKTTATAPGQPGAQTPEKAEQPAAPNPDKKGDAEPPASMVIEKEVKLELDPKVKKAVLDRIDIAPLSPKEKDKLYASVDKAKEMGLVITVPFAKGKAVLAQGDALALKDAFDQPEVAKLRASPFAVFVVLGYADPKGDPKTNLKTSRERADAVVAAIEREVGGNILVRAVGMGGTSMLDAQNLEKNRIAEVWVARP